VLKVLKLMDAWDYPELMPVKELSSGRGASSCAALRRTPRGPCRLSLLSWLWRLPV